MTTPKKFVASLEGNTWRAIVEESKIMQAIDHDTITDAVIEQMSGTPNPRLKQIMESLVRHLHEFAREVDLTPQEWLEGIRFLTAVGQKCTPFRQEFIMLSDTLGFSSLINALHDRRATQEGTKTACWVRSTARIRRC